MSPGLAVVHHNRGALFTHIKVHLDGLGQNTVISKRDVP